MNDLLKLRRLMKAANSLKKTKPVILRGAQLDASNALKYAWWFESFRDQLRNGIFRFSYFKKDGSIREARGTLCGVFIPKKNMPKSGMDPDAVEPVNTFRYYDLDAAGWRSFCLDNFIGFVTPAPAPAPVSTIHGRSGADKREKNQKRKPCGWE